VARELKTDEYRVALTPAGARELVQSGHDVLVERGAGDGSAFPDADYERAGARLGSVDDVWSQSELLLKVKEPIEPEYERLREGLVLFTYLHIAADAGAYFLEKPLGGRGLLLGGVPGVAPGRVLVIGGGVVGYNAAIIAIGLGAQVTILDRSIDRMRYLDEILSGRVSTLMSSTLQIESSIVEADVVIGAVLVPGARAPKLVTREMLGVMKKGAVIVDVAIDQGGCVETAHPTTHTDPVYEVDGITHYCVANMPGG